MARTDDQVVGILLEIYDATFGGKSGQRYLIRWSDLRSLYGFRKLFVSRFARLREAAAGQGLYLWELGEGDSGYMIAVVKMRTVDRWRRVPKRTIDEYAIMSDDDEGGDESDDE